MNNAMQAARLIGASSEEEIDRLYAKYCAIIAGGGCDALEGDVNRFLAEWCELEAHRNNENHYRTRTAAADLYDAFQVWHAKNREGRFEVSAKRFAEALNRNDIPAKRSNGTWRLGIRLNSQGKNALGKPR